MFKHFWASWDNGVFRVGYGFVMGRDVFLEKPNPSTIEINYLSLFNGWGSGGEWQIYAEGSLVVKPNLLKTCFFAGN